MSSPENPRLHVLLTNDDGIAAPGLEALAAALRPHADLTIVAPDVENSAMGHAISIFKDLSFAPFHRNGEVFGWGLAGTPADCVKVALHTFGRKRPFDMVISGINRGQNAGVNILYSGTVAAAREASMLGLPALAVSLFYVDENILHWDTAGRVAADAFAFFKDHPFPRNLMMNVNVPAVPYDQITGWAATHMGDSGYEDFFLHEPAGQDTPATYRNIGNGWFPSTHADPSQLDDKALHENKVSITPLQFDLTAYDFMPQLHQWVEEKK